MQTITNKSLAQAIKTTEAELLETSRNQFSRKAAQKIQEFETMLEDQNNWIHSTIKSEKNFHLLNPAHDRMEIIASFITTLETAKERKQMTATYDERMFDGWVD
jgi:hypothetical protein